MKYLVLNLGDLIQYYLTALYWNSELCLGTEFRFFPQSSEEVLGWQSLNSQGL